MQEKEDLLEVLRSSQQAKENYANQITSEEKRLNEL